MMKLSCCHHYGLWNIFFEWIFHDWKWMEVAWSQSLWPPADLRGIACKATCWLHFSSWQTRSIFYVLSLLGTIFILIAVIIDKYCARYEKFSFSPSALIWAVEMLQIHTCPRWSPSPAVSVWHSIDAAPRWIFYMAKVATGSRVEKSQAHLACWLPCLGLKIGQLQPGSRHVKRTWLVAALGGGFGTASGTAKGKSVCQQRREPHLSLF